jgi:NADPH-dependent curcumin reductase CurA
MKSDQGSFRVCHDQPALPQNAIAEFRSKPEGTVMPEMNHQILLANRPDGAASLSNFQSVEMPLGPLAYGEVRVRNHFLSLDPYMRGMMNDSKSYTAPQKLGEVMCGATAGVVTESRNEDWRAGDTVTGMFGWQNYGTSDGAGLQRVDATHVPLSAFLGVLGMTGVTAWYGLNRVCAPKPGETVAVSAASGAVGGRNAGSSASRVVQRNAGMLLRNSVSTPVSTTKTTRLTPTSRLPRRAESIAISIMSAGPCWMP